MSTQKGDGDVLYSILQENFGADGERNFSRVGISPVRQIWKKRIQNIAVDDIVLLKNDCHQNQWPMARIVCTDADTKNDVQSDTLRVADKKGGSSQILRCPITNEFCWWKMGSIPQQVEPYQNQQNERYFVGSQMKWCDMNLMLYNSIIWIIFFFE